MAKSQLLLNKVRSCFKLYGSIYPMESVTLRSFNFFGKSKMAFTCYIASKHHFVTVFTFDHPLYSKAT